MNTPSEDRLRNLAASMLAEGFPGLTPEDELIIAANLSGEADSESQAALSAILGSHPNLARMFETLRAEARTWQDDAAIGRLRQRAMCDARQDKRRTALKEIWSGLCSLASRVKEECALALDDFVPHDFELAGALLGGHAGDEFFPVQVVKPWVGQSLGRTTFSIQPPKGIQSMELDVSDESGSIYRKELPFTPGSPVEIAFQSVGMKEGRSYKWRLACELADDPDGERDITRGTVAVTPPDKKEAVMSLASRAAVSGSTPLERGLLESAVLCEQQCFDAFLSNMEQLQRQHRAVRDQQSALLLSHWAFRRMRNHLLAAGLSGEGDRVYGLLFGVEKELERIT